MHVSIQTVTLLGPPSFANFGKYIPGRFNQALSGYFVYLIHCFYVVFMFYVLNTIHIVIIKSVRHALLQLVQVIINKYKCQVNKKGSGTLETWLSTLEIVNLCVFRMRH